MSIIIPDCYKPVYTPLSDGMDSFSAAMIADGEWELTSFEPSEENYLAAYQYLIDTGTAWQLQGRIGRTAADLINSGLCHAAGDDA